MWSGFSEPILHLNGIGTAAFLILFFWPSGKILSWRKLIAALWIVYNVITICLYFKDHSVIMSVAAHGDEAVETITIDKNTQSDSQAQAQEVSIRKVIDWDGALSKLSELIIILVLAKYLLKSSEKDNDHFPKPIIIFTLAFIIIISIVAAINAYYKITSVDKKIAYKEIEAQGIEEKAEYHIHSDIVVFLEGELLDLSQEKYQSNTYDYKDPAIHLHDRNGQILHLHKPDVTLKEFFTTLGIDSSKDCLILDTGAQYCIDDEHILTVLVNGTEVTQSFDYVIQDLDQIVVEFAHGKAPSQKAIQAVSNEACIYSLTCPERGAPPAETCIADPDVPCSIQ